MEDVLLNFSFFLPEINVLNAGFFLQYMFYIVIKTEGENDKTTLLATLDLSPVIWEHAELSKTECPGPYNSDI